jgi:Tol biopolymer transport system component
MSKPRPILLATVMAGCSAVAPSADGGSDAGWVDAGPVAPGPGQLLFVRMASDGGRWFTRLDLSDGGLERLPGAMHGARPAPSPDRKAVLFSMPDPVDPQGPSGVWLLELEAGTSRRLSSPAAGVELEASFSPDGNEVLFTSQTIDPRGDIMRASWRDGGFSEVENLTPSVDSIADRTPAWSPDGLQVAFTSYREGSPTLWVMSRDGARPRRVTEPGNHGDFNPAWAPDGKGLAFQRVSSEGAQVTSRLGLLDLDAGTVRFFELPGPVYEPAFSPDGHTVALWGRFEDRTVEDLVLVTLDGGVRRLDTGAQERSPVWW